METLEIRYDTENLIKIYKRYFAFERRKGFRKMKGHLLLNACLIGIMIVTGVVIEMDILIYLGIIIAGIFIVYIITYLIRFRNVEVRTIKGVVDEIERSEKTAKFSFDEDKLILSTADSSYEVSWRIIPTYELNGGDVYLFDESGSLLNIISESIIGKEKMVSFKAILKKRIGEPED